MGCRFIALNNGVDTIHKNNEMLVILKNVMNDLYARDTSNKIRAVKQSTFKAGKYVGCYAPIGYLKSPEDKHVFVIDLVTAPIVKRIFDLRCQGYSYRKIATILNTENVPTPTGFYYMRRGKPNIRKDGDFWAAPTVKAILRNEVYLGHMVQNKTGNLSYKVHKQITKPESEWIRVENTHEPIISQETWDMVRELDARNAKFRSDKAGETALFTGVLFCMDCKSPMRRYWDSRKHKDGSHGTYQGYVCNRYAAGGKTACSAHVINQRVLIELLLIDIRFKAALAQNQPDALKEKIMAQKNAAGMEQRRTLQSTMDALDKRLTELEK
ncbi:MAG: recombinase family protein, partial [Oscillospiraceae bacterium]|nr:recombinase family protein [Oscillospiraceae bacterium]